MAILAAIYFLLFAALAYRLDKLALALLMVLLPTYGLRFSIWGVPSTFLEVAIWAIALVWFYKQWRLHGTPHWPKIIEARSAKNPFAPYLWPILLWVLAATLSAVISPNPVAALGIWKAYFVDPLLVFVLVVAVFYPAPEESSLSQHEKEGVMQTPVDQGKDRGPISPRIAGRITPWCGVRGTKESWWLIYAMGFTVAVLSILAWYQKFTGLWLPEPWATTLPLRVTSWYSYPNAVGLFVGPILAMYIVWLMQDIYPLTMNSRGGGRKSPKILPHLWKLAVFVLGTGAIIFSVTKGAWVGVAAGAVVGALFVFQSYWRKIFLGGVLLAIMLLVFMPAIRGALWEQFTFQSPSGKMRLVVWEETIALLKDHPIQGAGLAGYQMALKPYHQEWRKNISPYKLEIFLYPHNVFLNFWVELGLTGLIVFLWLLAVFGRMVWQKRADPMAQLSAAAMVALLVHGLVDVPYFKNDLAVLFWLIMALPLLVSASSSGVSSD